MIFFSILIVLIGFLFLLSSKTINLLFNLFYKITKNKTVSISLLCLIIYPGVVVHELAHFITAAILLVPVKNISLVPEKINTGIKPGSVTIGHTDLVRRTLVGIAPLFAGILALFAVIIYLFPPFLCHFSENKNPYDFITTSTRHEITINILCNKKKWSIIKNSKYKILNTILVIYLLFSISTTMYSSKKDLESLKVLMPILFAVAGILYIGGFQWQQFIYWVDALGGISYTVSLVLLIPIVLQLALLVLIYIMHRILFLLN